jgi:hypothetical protein
LQSGLFWGDIEAMYEIGDYAVASNLSYAIHGSVSNDVGLNNQLLYDWLIDAKERWGKQFIGIYYDDEPGGKMLDRPVILENTVYQVEGTPTTFINFKTTTGVISVQDNTTITQYMPDGTIFRGTNEVAVTYYPNGTLEVLERKGEDYNRNFYTPENITQCQLPIQSYAEILKRNPMRNHDEAAKTFVNLNKNSFDEIDKKSLNEKSILVFTADYGLYWWDYQIGYDVMLAELGWNNSIAQEIGLVRGAANLQGKNWGTIITWKYTQSPYLANGNEIYDQMKTSYETGADYIIIFNYSENPTNPNTLQEEHFQAMERFWNDVVQNPKIKHGNIKAEAVLVLPQNYGWGMRNPDDNIWGIWPADDTSQAIWNQLQNKIDKHGLKLDIIYEDPNYPVTGKYSTIYYWDQK